MTYAEGQAFYQTQQDAKNKAAEKLKRTKEQDAEYQQQVKTVQDSITKQLTDAGVYSDAVSKEYAKLPLAFIRTTAHRLGMTPLEFYQQHGAKIIGDDIGRRLGGTGEGFRAANLNVDPNQKIQVVDLSGAKPLKISGREEKAFIKRWKGAPLEIGTDPNGKVTVRLSKKHRSILFGQAIGLEETTLHAGPR